MPISEIVLPQPAGDQIVMSPAVPLESPAPPDEPKYRALRVYAFDPSRGRRLGNYMTVRVKYEKLEKELRGAQLHVIDYDAAIKGYYKPADLNSPAALVEGGFEPSESDPRFHQQMVYAVAMQTINTFQQALGRDIRYSFARQGDDATRLLIFPHAMYEANAYYSRELGALLFGYFKASDDNAGSGLPGGTVFTCLSHDIVAHETTHSIIDTLRSAFMEPSNPDVPAFHEAFADIVALFQHFSFEDVVRDTLRRSGGILHRFNLVPRGGQGSGSGEKSFIIGEMPEGNPLLDLARQFGESMGRRAALRSALGVRPDPQALANATEPHERGAVLVAAVFDAFFTAFMERSADLIRMARAAGGGSDDIHPDLAARLAKEAARTAQHFCTMCIRAIDYCPPVDITFGEFLRALITADTMLYASDEHEYRETLIQAFRARGIYPAGVPSLAEESLLWDKPAQGTPICPTLRFNLINPDQHTSENRDALEAVIRTNPFCFGLCEDEKHDCATCTCQIPESEKVVKSINTVIRGGEQRPRVEFVAEIVRSVPLDGDPTVKFSGGSTVIFDSAGRPEMVVYKKLSSQSRRKTQRDLVQAGLAAAAPYDVPSDKQTRLASIHRGLR
jgi:hypothetical protein